MDPNIRLRRSVCKERKKNKCNGTEAERWKYKKDEKLISKRSKNQTNKHLRFSNNKVFIGRIILLVTEPTTFPDRQAGSTLTNENIWLIWNWFSKGLMARALGVNNKECSLSLLICLLFHLILR